MERCVLSLCLTTGRGEAGALKGWLPRYLVTSLPLYLAIGLLLPCGTFALSGGGRGCCGLGKYLIRPFFSPPLPLLAYLPRPYTRYRSTLEPDICMTACNAHPGQNTWALSHSLPHFGPVLIGADGILGVLDSTGRKRSL